MELEEEVRTNHVCMTYHMTPVMFFKSSLALFGLFLPMQVQQLRMLLGASISSVSPCSDITMPFLTREPEISTWLNKRTNKSRQKFYGRESPLSEGFLTLSMYCEGSTTTLSFL